MATDDAKSGRGRPAGAANVKEKTTSVLSACPACGCTDRYVLHKYPDTEFGGTLSDGRRFTHVVRRRVRCERCGQVRIDITHECK